MPAKQDGQRDEQRAHGPGHGELDEHDERARHRLGQEVDDRSVVELRAERRRTDDHAHERQECRHAEVRQQATGEADRLVVAWIAEAEDDGHHHDEGAEQSQQQGPAPIEQRPERERGEREDHRRTR